jgi:hypothetical protein
MYSIRTRYVLDTYEIRTRYIRDTAYLVALVLIADAARIVRCLLAGALMNVPVLRILLCRNEHLRFAPSGECEPPECRCYWPALPSRIHSEENHRWTQINTDKDCPITCFHQKEIRSPNRDAREGEETPEFSPQNLCPSVFICGCTALSRPRVLRASRRDHPVLRSVYSAGTIAVVSFWRSSQPLTVWRVRMKTRAPTGGTPYRAT